MLQVETKKGLKRVDVSAFSVAAWPKSNGVRLSLEHADWRVDIISDVKSARKLTNQLDTVVGALEDLQRNEPA